MTDPTRCLIAALLDRSGSMQAIKDDTDGGFNAFVDQQRGQPGDVRVTLAQFDTQYEVVYANRPLDDVPPLDLLPRGATALYDALGRLITDVGADLAARPESERPGKVLIVVLTDGQENSSREWSHRHVSAAIHRQEDEYSWEFLFLGANMDAVAVGENLGFRADRSMTYAASGDGVSAAFDAAGQYAARRLAAPAGTFVRGFSEEDRRAAQGAGKP
jgi:hypothetical protein